MKSLFFLKILGFSATFLFFSIGAKYIPIEKFGLLMTLLALSVPLTFLFSSGLPLTANTMISQNKIHFKLFYFKSLKLICFSCLLFSTILFIPITLIYQLPFHETIIYLIFIFLNCVLFLNTQMFQSIEKTKLSFIFNIYGMKGVFLPISLIFSILFIGLIEMDFEISYILFYFCICVLSLALSSFFILKKYFSLNNNKNQYDSIKLIKNGAALSLHNIFASMYIPILLTIIFVFFQEKTLSVYQANTRILIVLMNFANSVLMPIFIPKIGALFIENRKSFFDRLKKMFLINLLLVSSVFFVFYFAYENIIIALANEKYILKLNDFFILFFSCTLFTIFNPLINSFSYLQNNNFILSKIHFLNLIIMFFIIFLLKTFNYFNPQIISLIILGYPNIFLAFYILKFDRFRMRAHSSIG